MKVWIVGLQDSGDNGWSVAMVFDSKQKADYWLDTTNDPRYGYYMMETSGDADEGWEVH